MGNLIKQLHLLAQVPDQIATTLLTSKKRRDFLAHNFFRERAVDFTTIHGREAMLEELKKDQQLFEKADNALSTYIEPFQKVRVSPEDLDRATAALIAQWNADPSKPKPKR